MQLRTAILLTLIAPALALGDTLIEMGNPQGELDVVYRIKDGKVLWEDPSDPGTVYIFDSRDGSMTQVDNRAKSYTRVDNETLDQAQKSVEDAMSAMQDQVAAAMKQMEGSLTPEQIEAMKQFMPGSMKEKRQPVITVRREGSDEVAGIRCSKAMVLEDNVPTQELCVADAKALGIPKSDFDAARAMLKTMGEMSARFGANEMSSFIEEIEGLPVRSRDLENDQAYMLRSVSTEPQEGQAFEVPANYTESDLLEGLGP